MIAFKLVGAKNKASFNRLAQHPLQLWEWGDFKAKRGAKPIRIAGFDQSGKMVKVGQLFQHKLPFGRSLLYYPRGGNLSPAELDFLTKLGRSLGTFMIKIEPYLEATSANLNQFSKLGRKHHFKKSSQPLFPEYTLRLDLKQDHDQIWSNLSSKARYNVGLAQRKGVKIIEDTSYQGVDEFNRLISLTTRRHNFLAHKEDYYYDLFESFRTKNIIKILKAVYDQKTIAVWWLFDWQNILYYPYGASDYKYRRLMASNLLAWKAIEYGLDHKKEIFDLWGAAPPDASPSHPWAGFSRFKLSYGAKYWRTIGSWDLVLDPGVYHFFNLASKLRKFYLKQIRPKFAFF